MDRRDFLKAAAAAPLAAYLPAQDGGLSVADIKFAISKFTGYTTDGVWYAFLHPSQERDLRDLAARERWRDAFRAWRKDGRPPLSCVEVLDKYAPIHSWDVDLTAGLGSFENVRYVVADRK